MLTEDPTRESSDERTILEVRIHGVLNSPPRDMLLLDDDDIRRANGDALGAFYTTSPEKAPRPTEDRPTTDILGKVRREAYSWGAMPRSSGGDFSVIGTFFVQLGWLLVAPYGLVNMAYWMRDVPVEPTGSDPRWSAAVTTWRGGRGSGSIRLFALALTLLLVVTVSVLALDVIGVQCYRAEQAVCSQLPAVFDVIAPLARPARLAVLGVVPILVVLLIYLIGRRGRVRYEANVRGWVDKLDGARVSPSTARATVEAHPAGSDEGTQERAGAPPVATPPPHLATANFWSSARIGQTTEYLHFATSIAFVLMLLANDLVWSRSGVCSPLDRPEEDCLGIALGDRWGWLGVVAGVTAVAFFLAGAISVWIASNTRTDRVRRHRMFALALLLATVAAYVAYAGIAIWWSLTEGTGCAPSAACFDVGGADPTPFVGMRATPSVLIIAAVGVCVSAIGWWRGVPLWLSLVLGLAWFVLVTASILTWTSNTGLSKSLLAGGIAALTLVAVAGWLWPRRPWAHRDLPQADREPLKTAELDRLSSMGWNGCGAAVTLTLALFLAMTLSTMFVMGITAYLTIPEWTVTTTEMLRGRPHAAFGSAESIIDLPAAYTRFSVVVVVVLVVVGIVAAAAAVQGIPRYFEYSTPSLSESDRGDEVLVAHVTDYGVGGVARRLRLATDRAPDLAQGLLAETPHVKRVLATRRLTQFAHRGEPLLGLIAVVAIVVMIALMVSPLRRTITELTAFDGSGLPAVTAPLLAVVALALIGIVFQNSMNSKERPLGLLWDIMGLLPRAGHPFGPPCYTERVVPELSARIDEWLGIDSAGSEEDDGGAHQPATKPGHRVVLTAHSLGLPLAIAVILGNSSRDGWRGRVGLVSYGVQVRSYFGRFFPNVYGPDVLGVHPVPGPSLFGADPWTKAVQADWRRARSAQPEVDGSRFSPTLRDVLKRSTDGGDRPEDAWLNLWRRTDYLGMPAYSYADWSNRDAQGQSLGPDAADPARNPIDCGATERLADAYIWGVATHSNYLETRQFEAAFDTVARRIGSPPPARAGV